MLENGKSLGIIIMIYRTVTDQNTAVLGDQNLYIIIVIEWTVTDQTTAVSGDQKSIYNNYNLEYRYRSDHRRVRRPEVYV